MSGERFTDSMSPPSGRDLDRFTQSQAIRFAKPLAISVRSR